ncbi:MAG: transporter substrate-binding domain-containing protein, partial [Lachnospiraceae bacterium]|nr:transporter substrate-binding domain-containing protein [Lachnospiraceae bacterium]
MKTLQHVGHASTKWTLNGVALKKIRRKSIMRKSPVIVLSLLMVCILAGCGSNGASGDHLEKIKAAGKITVATEGAWAPFTYHDETTNELVGFDVEVAREIAKRIGVEAEFAEGDFDGGLTGVSQGTFDMMA